jgi:hypothetical protein
MAKETKKRVTRIKKSPKGLRPPITPENFEARMLELYPNDIHKEIYWTQKAAGETLYYWYHEFFRASQVLPAVRKEVAGRPGSAEAMQKLDGFFGTDPKMGFKDWWGAGGAAHFAEKGVPRIKVINGRPEQEQSRRELGLAIVLPLNISRDILIEQFNFVLEAYHPKNALRRHASSTADLKIYPRQRYRDTNYGLLLALWKKVRPLKDAKQSVTWWRVYSEASGKSASDIEKLSGKGVQKQKQRNQLMRTAKKLYKQADRLMKNALLGDFPRDQGNSLI